MSYNTLSLTYLQATSLRLSFSYPTATVSPRAAARAFRSPAQYSVTKNLKNTHDKHTSCINIRTCNV